MDEQAQQVAVPHREEMEYSKELYNFEKPKAGKKLLLIISLLPFISCYFSVWTPIWIGNPTSSARPSLVFYGLVAFAWVPVSLWAVRRFKNKNNILIVVFGGLLALTFFMFWEYDKTQLHLEAMMISEATTGIDFICQKEDVMGPETRFICYNIETECLGMVFEYVLQGIEGIPFYRVISWKWNFYCL
jgi:hypothetical protein